MKKQTHQPTYGEALDGLLKAIDDAPTAPGHPIFKKCDDKEFFETQLMFSFRKQQGKRCYQATCFSGCGDA